MLRLSLIGLCACGRIAFEPLSAQPGDAALPDAAVFNGGFGNLVSLGIDGSDPYLRDDGLEVWIAFQTPSYELRSARRTSITDPFPVPVVSPVDSPESETDPSLTEDGLEMFFISSRNNETALFRSVRASANDDFTTDSSVVELEGFGTFSASLANDNVMYLLDGEGLFRTERPDGGAFGVPTRVEAPGFGWPAVSSNELEIFINVDPAVEIAVNYGTRSSVDEPFTLVNKLDFGGICASNRLADPQLSRDGKTLVIRCSSEIVMLTR